MWLLSLGLSTYLYLDQSVSFSRQKKKLIANGLLKTSNLKKVFSSFFHNPCYAVGKGFYKICKRVCGITDASLKHHFFCLQHFEKLRDSLSFCLFFRPPFFFSIKPGRLGFYIFRLRKNAIIYGAHNNNNITIV